MVQPTKENWFPAMYKLQPRTPVLVPVYDTWVSSRGMGRAVSVKIVDTGPYLKTSSTYDVHQNQCLHAMHTLTRLHRFKPFLVVNHVQKIAYIALANAQKTSMPCQNLEFDRDFWCMLYLLHREVSRYLLEEVSVHPPRVHYFHFF